LISAFSPPRLGAWIAAITLVLDQATKLALLFIVDIEAVEPIRVLPVFDLVLVWNQGISYGLFQQESAFGKWLLAAISVMVAIGLGFWLSRATNRFLGLALGLLIGGAVGNAIDRAAYGAVVDFAHFHWGRFSWYVFNVADIAIVVGVSLLLYDSLVSDGRRGGAGEGA
jgi:signal peptidase II